MQKKKESLIAKFLKFSYGSWVGLILGVATTMLTTRVLEPDALGKSSMFELVLQVGMIITIFGTDQSLVRFFYEEEKEKRGALLYNTLRVPTITTILILLLLFIWYKPLTIYLIGQEDINFAFWIGIGIVAQLLFRYSQLIIRMQQKANLYSLLQIFQRVFNLAFILMFYYFIGSRFEIMIYSKVVTLILLIFIAIYFGKEYWGFRNLKIKSVKHTQKDIIRFGSPYVLTLFITWIFESFDKIALRQWSDFDELGMYSAAMRLVALVSVLRTTFSTFWTPVAYEKFEKDPEDKNFFQKMSTIVSFAMFFVAILSIASKDIIVMLLGKNYKEAADIMPFLVFMPIFYTISHTTVMGINFYKKTHWHIVIAVVSCLVNIIGNWLLVPNFGAFGASLATAFSFIVFFTLRTQISLRFFKVNYPLIKIYAMVLIVSIYAFASIFIAGFWLNILLSIIPLTTLIILYFKDLNLIYKTYKDRWKQKFL